MAHIMVDLETWGKTPGSAIRSIGAVVFDFVTGEVGKTFYANIKDEWSGLTKDDETVAWWEKQGPEAIAAFENSEADILPIVLEEFSEWWTRNAGGQFWAKGPHFDEAILGAAYRVVGKKVPWSFWGVRDLRTLHELAGSPTYPFTGTAHNALDDAVHQANLAIHGHKILRGDNPIAPQAPAKIAKGQPRKARKPRLPRRA